MSSGTKLQSKECSSRPELIFTQIAWEKMWLLTRAAKNKTGKVFECTSFGIMDPNNACRVLDLWVPEQTNSGSSTEADDDSVLEWMMEMKEKEVDMGQLTFWQHSHADMGVFFSSTDISTIRRMECDHIQWSVVTNITGDILVRADIFNPIRYWWSDCNYEIEYPAVEGLDEWSAEQYEKMTFEVPLPKKWDNKNRGNYPVSPYIGAGFNKAPNNQEDFPEDWQWQGYMGLDTGMGLDIRTNEEEFESVHTLTSKTDRPHLDFTHNGIQEAYDGELITVKEAENLEHAHCLGAKTAAEIADELTWLVENSRK